MPVTHNGITLQSYVDKFTSQLDSVVMQGTATADLNMNQDLLGKLSNTGSIEVAKITMDGLADHVRGNGYVGGTASLTWETIQLAYERSREFSVDALDDEETAAVLSANLMNEFARTKVVPEVDAVRFARIFGFVSSSDTQVAAANVSQASDAVAAVQAGEAYLENLGVDLRGCILYASAAFKNLLRNAQNWQAGFGQNPNTGITEYDGMKLVVPSGAVFKTSFDLLDGIDHTSASGADETAGGFAAASGANDLNFLIIDPRAVGAIVKHQQLRYFAPGVNQKDNAHLWQYHIYHDLVGYDNKKALIYAHKKAS